MDQRRTTRNKTSVEPARVFIVSGHAPERCALQEMFEDEGLAMLGTTGSVREGLAVIPRLRPDLATKYREIACSVAGARGSSVLVVAAPADTWNRYTPLLEPAVDSYLGE